MKWYIVKTQSNREKSVSEKIAKESEKGILSGKMGRIIVPIEKIINIKNGKKIFREKVMYPGYIFVETNAIGELATYVKGCDGATNLLSDKSGKIQSISNSEVERIIGITQKIEDNIEKNYISGQEIRITEGPFSSFTGIIESIIDQKVKVSVTIFGRKTPLELDISQIKKI